LGISEVGAAETPAQRHAIVQFALQR